MIRTYRAKYVRLVEQLPLNILGGNNGLREIVATDERIESIHAAPEVMAVLVRLVGGAEFQSKFVHCEYEQGSLANMLELHQCEVCGQEFENSQGLGSHRRTMHPGQQVAVSKPGQQQVQAKSGQGQVRR